MGQETTMKLWEEMMDLLSLEHCVKEGLGQIIYHLTRDALGHAVDGCSAIFVLVRVCTDVLDALF